MTDYKAIKQILTSGWFAVRWMNDHLAVLSHAHALRAHARNVLHRQVHDAALARGHGIQAEGLLGLQYAFRSDARGHFQFFETQRPVAAAIDVNFLVVGRFQPQRLEGQVFECLQNLAASLQQNLLVAPVEIGEHFCLAFCGSAVSGSGAHVDVQVEAASAHDAFKKLPQRLGGGPPVKLAVSNEFKGHKAPYLKWCFQRPDSPCLYNRALGRLPAKLASHSCRAPACRERAADASGSNTTAARSPPRCW